MPVWQHISYSVVVIYLMEKVHPGGGDSGLHKFLCEYTFISLIDLHSKNHQSQLGHYKGDSFLCMSTYVTRYKYINKVYMVYDSVRLSSMGCCR